MGYFALADSFKESSTSFFVRVFCRMFEVWTICPLSLAVAHRAKRLLAVPPK